MRRIKYDEKEKDKQKLEVMTDAERAGIRFCDSWNWITMLDCNLHCLNFCAVDMLC